jgi:hypothetical protein
MSYCSFTPPTISFFENNATVFLVIILFLIILSIPRLVTFFLKKIDNSFGLQTDRYSDSKDGYNSNFKRYYDKYFKVVTGQRYPQIKLIILQTLIFFAPVWILTLIIPAFREYVFSFFDQYNSFYTAITSEPILLIFFTLYSITLFVSLGFCIYHSFQYPPNWIIIRVLLILLFTVPIILSTMISFTLLSIVLLLILIVWLIRLFAPLLLALAVIIGIVSKDND